MVHLFIYFIKYKYIGPNGCCDTKTNTQNMLVLIFFLYFFCAQWNVYVAIWSFTYLPFGTANSATSTNNATLPFSASFICEIWARNFSISPQPTLRRRASAALCLMYKLCSRQTIIHLAQAAVAAAMWDAFKMCVQLCHRKIYRERRRESRQNRWFGMRAEIYTVWTKQNDAICARAHCTKKNHTPLQSGECMCKMFSPSSWHSRWIGKSVLRTNGCMTCSRVLRLHWSVCLCHGNWW